MSIKVTLISVSFPLLRSPDIIILQTSPLLVDSWINVKLFSVSVLKPRSYFLGASSLLHPTPLIKHLLGSDMDGARGFAYIIVHPHTKSSRCHHPCLAGVERVTQEVRQLAWGPTAANGRARIQIQFVRLQGSRSSCRIGESLQHTALSNGCFTTTRSSLHPRGSS